MVYIYIYRGEVYILELFPREKRYKIIGVCSDNREGKEVTINCSEDNAPIVRCLQFVSGNVIERIKEYLGFISK